jgi:hypothetical protein
VRIKVNQTPIKTATCTSPNITSVPSKNVITAASSLVTPKKSYLNAEYIYDKVINTNTIEPTKIIIFCGDHSISQRYTDNDQVSAINIYDRSHQKTANFFKGSLLFLREAITSLSRPTRAHRAAASKKRTIISSVVIKVSYLSLKKKSNESDLLKYIFIVKYIKILAF